MKNFALAVFPSVLLCSCAATNDMSEVEPWSPTGSCVDDLSSLEARQLPDNVPETQWLQFRSEAECLQTGDLYEPVVLFSLEALEKADELDVILDRSDSRVLAARVEVLNRDLETIDQYTFDSFAFRGDRFTQRLFFNWQDNRPGYLLLAVDHQSYGHDMEQVSGRRVTSVWMAGNFIGTISDGTEQHDHLMFRDVGRFSIRHVPRWID